MNLSRAFVIVLDSLGVGALPDAAAFGDEGAHTLDHLVGANGGLRGADGRRREDGRRVDVRVAATSGGRVVAAASGGRGVKTR